MANKMTKKDWFEAIGKVVETSGYDRKDEALAFIAHEVELLERKSGSDKLTKRQKENLGVCGLIHDALFEVAKPVTISELVAATPGLAGLSNQKISALLKLMREKGIVKRSEIKSKAYFELA